MNDEILQHIIGQLAVLPASSLSVEELTERDKVALCIAAGCEILYHTEFKKGSMYFVATTKRRCGFAKTADGQFRVFEEAPDTNLLTVNVGDLFCHHNEAKK